MDAAQYLRKSRMEEGMDTEEVLSKHRKALTDYAAAHGIHVAETYCEVVSGESLYARPEMLRLLQDVEDGKYDAVLVMDLDRLSRGRMKDQGIILDTFRESDTRIVTPEKTYNLSDELDDEIAEFKTFMSRREYKIINKRLRRGLNQSIQAGCYVANAPYGYRKITVDKRPTLEIVEEEASFVRMMYGMYADGYGCTSIARHINALGARPRRTDAFSRSSVAGILRNPTYIGKIVWDQKKHVKKGGNGTVKHITIYQPREKWTIVDGLHPAIIEKEQYDKVQAIMGGRYTSVSNDGTVKNPLAGLVKCAVCGRNMQRMGSNQGAAYLLCGTPACCAGTKFELVEEQVLRHLEKRLAGITLEKPARVPSKGGVQPEERLAAVRREQRAAEGQKARLHELLELGEYDIPTFRARMDKVKEKTAALERQEAELLRAQASAAQASAAQASAARPGAADPVRRVRTLLEAYEASDAAHRNALLKSVIGAVWYRKEKKTRPLDFTLTLEIKDF